MAGSSGRPPNAGEIKTGIRDFAFRLLSRVFGKRRARLIVTAVVVVALLALWLGGVSITISNVADLFGPVSRAVVAGYYRLMPVPQAELGTFTVAVAWLSDDSDYQMEKLIVDDLQEIGWIQVLEIHRVIRIKGGNRTKQLLEAQARASEYLRKSGAQILVWGAVLSDGTRRVPQLFLSSRPDPLNKPDQGRFPLNDALQLPPLFWKQLGSVLDLLVASQSASYLARREPAQIDDLQPFVDEVRKLLSESKGDPTWDKETTADVQNALAMALWSEADLTGRKAPLAEAIQILESLVKIYDPKNEQQSLGLTFLDLGIARLALAALETRSGTTGPTGEQEMLLRNAVDALNESAKVDGRTAYSPKQIFEVTTIVGMMAFLGAQQHAWDTIDEALRSFRESKNIPQQDRQAYGQILFFCFFLGSTPGSPKVHVDPEMLGRFTALFLSLQRSPLVKKYPALSIAVRRSLGSAFLLQAQNKEQRGSDDSLRSAIAEFREVISDQHAAGESPRLSDWGRLADALMVQGVLDGGQAGISSLAESVAICRNVLYPYDPEHASLDWFIMLALTAQSLESLAQRNVDYTMACKAFARSIIAERGYAKRALFGDILLERDEALSILRSLKTKFGQQKTADCQAATREFLKVFGPS